MFDGIIKVVEKIIDLINIKQKNDQEFLNDILSPLFHEFEEVAENYFKLFQSRGKPKHEIIEIRNTYLQTRIKITEMAKVYIEKVENKKILDFLNAINDFFFGIEKVPANFPSTAGQYFVELFTGKVELIYLERHYSTTEIMYKDLQLKWGRVVSAYTDLKLEYGTPVGYKA